MTGEQTFELVVGPEFGGMRLDKWLPKAVPAMSRTRMQKLIRAGCVFDDDGEVVADANIAIREGEVYSVIVPAAKSEEPARPENIPVEILYEDDDLVIVDKPAGMVVHKGAGVDTGTLVNALLHHTGGRLSSVGMSAGRPGIVHRIDKNTSGAMLVCKTDAAHRAMYKKFENHEIKRQYLALAWGIISPASGTIDAPIARNRKDRTRMCVAMGGKPAITHYETVRVFTGPKRKPLSLLRLNLETGRTHQIRVHLAHIGNPILGDTSYGNMGRHLQQVEDRAAKAIFSGAGRQMLHSFEIEFAHPSSGEKIRCITKMPKDMEHIIKALECKT